MNLQEVLNYRNSCIICGRKMILRSQDLLRLDITVSENGLVIKTGHKNIGIHFKNDGTYQKNTKFSKLLIDPFILVKECPTCRKGKSGSSTYFFKSRSAGFSSVAKSTLDSLKDSVNYYTIDICGNDDGTFTCHIDEECIKYHDGEAFWHAAAKHQEDETKLTHGFYQDKFGDVFTMKLPLWNTSKLRDINHFLDRYKTFIIFS